MTQPPLRQYLARMIRFAPGICLIHAVLWGVMNFSSLVPAWLVSRFIGDLEAGDASMTDSRWLVIVLVLIALGQAVLWLVAGFTEITMRFWMSGLLRTNMLRLILATPSGRRERLAVGDIISRFRDDAYAGEDALDWTDEIWIHSLFTLGAVAILFAIDPIVTVASLVPMVLVTIVVQRARDRLTRLREASSAATSDVTGAVGDAMASIATIQAFGAEQRVLAHLRSLGDARRSTMLRDRVLSETIDQLMSNVVNVGYGLIMLLAASRLRDGAMSIGEFVLFVTWFGQITGFASDFGQYLSHMAQSGVAFERMHRIVPDTPPLALVEKTSLGLRGDLPDTHELSPPGLPPFRELAIDGLTYEHPESDRGIRDVSFRVPRGSLTVITGRVGSGKSTLVQVLLGRVEADRGDVHWNGETVVDRDTAFVPPRVGSIPQVPALVSDTLRNAILLGLPDADGARLDRAIRAAVLDRDIASFDDGLNTLIGTRGTKLSGGQLQRTAAARMFAREPELLVMDDLSSALDVETERELWSRIAEMDGVTCLAVSTRMAALRRADQIVLMDGGRVLATGSLTDLLRDHAEMRAIGASREATP